MVTVNFTGNSVVTNFNENPSNQAESHYKIVYHCANYAQDHIVLVNDNVGVISGGTYDGMRVYRDILTHEQLVAAGVTRRFNVDLYTVNANGTPSAPYTVEAYNPPPGAANGIITSSEAWAQLTLTPITDEDFVGYKVWMSTTTPVIKDDANLVYNGPNSQVNIKVDPSTTYYVRFYGYDAFGEDDAIETEISFTTQDAPSFDTVAPAVPTGLTLGGGLAQQASGEQLALFVANWNKNTEDDMAYYILAVQEGSGAFVYYNVGQSPDVALPAYSYFGKKGTSYTAKIQAVDIWGNASAFSSTVTASPVVDTVPPGPATSFVVLNSFKNLYLSWTNPSDSDLAGSIIYVNSDPDSSTATVLTQVNGRPGEKGSYTHSGLDTNITNYYWIKSIDTSGNLSSFSSINSGTTGQVDYIDLSAGSVRADTILAGEITGDKFNTATSLPGSITVGSTGVTIETLTDPAQLINDGTTNIQPGRIEISGSSTLDSWLYGPDQTLIDGGAIGANSIAVNAVKVGGRGLTITGIDFQYIPGTDTLTWTAGSIGYIDDDGTAVSKIISAGSQSWGGTTMYVYWHKGNNALAVTTTLNSIIIDADNVIFNTWTGSGNMIPNYGGTIINGARITTNSIAADRLLANSVLAQNVFIGSNEFRLDGSYAATNKGTMVVASGGVDLVKIGWLSPSTVGFELRNSSNQVIFNSSSSPVSAAVLSADGVLSGGGTGALAFTSANVGNAFANDSIGGTYILNLSGDKIDVNSITANKLNVTSLDAVTATIGTLRTASSGGRVEIKDNVIKVFDASNALRVKLGNLSL